MKLWVAENVLEDYTSGMAVIYAKNEIEAIEKLYEKDSTSWIVLYNWLDCKCSEEEKKGEDWSEHIYKHHKPERLPNCFKLVTDSEAFTVHGGS